MRPAPALYFAHAPPPGFFPADATRLTWYFGDLDGEIGGVRSSWGSVVAAAMNGGPTGRRPSELSVDHPIEALERTTQARRLAALLERVPGPEHRILERAYGPRNPRDRFDVWGTLAPIAAMTPAVHEARELLALVRGLTAEKEVRQTAAGRIDDAVTAFWRTVERRMLLRERERVARRAVRTARGALASVCTFIAGGKPAFAEASAELDRTLAALQAVRVEIAGTKSAMAAAIQRAESPHVVLPAVLDALSHADHATTVDGAIAHVLAFGSAKCESGRNPAGRRRFIETVRGQAHAMLVDAETSFVRAKRNKEAGRAAA